ncbi:hypothetical protein ACE1CD_15540 [Aerosakkonema sp. BLCC-F183]|uniref:hypothetical protein n=1 Tax=Aerosakkonema sp. BLCC-F183 TaxID=3342834 RepID=UPI0035B9584B
MTELTGAIASKLLKTIVADYNFWGESEGDSPLAVKRAKVPLDEKKILALDASARKKAEQIEGYKAPERTIVTKTLDEVFKPLVTSSLLQLEGKSNSILEGTLTIESLESAAEATEYYIQLYSAFKQLNSPKVCYVEDASDPYTGMFIIGTSADGQTVFAQSLLIQT